MRRATVLALILLIPGACSSPAATAPVATPSIVLPASTATSSTVSNEGGTDWMATALAFDERLGEHFAFHCPPGGTAWPIDGTDVYTSISSVCTAAAHVGLITVADGGEVTIEMRPGQDSYVGSRRNGVNSDDHGPWQASFVLVSGGVALTPAPAVTPTPADRPTDAPAATPTAAAATPTPSSADLGLITLGELATCMSFGRARFAERDSAGEPIGVDVEIAQALAQAMSLEAVITEMDFDVLIDSVVNGECDVTISGHFITDARLARLDLIPYREGIPHVVVRKGNPAEINDLDDLCGRTFAVVSGTIYVDMVLGQGDYEGAGLNDRCASSSAPDIDLRQFAVQSDAEAALGDGSVDAYAGNDFIVRDRPSEFELALELPRVRNGVGHRLGLDALDEGLREALRTIIDNGTYGDILEQYGVEEVALTIRP